MVLLAIDPFLQPLRSGPNFGGSAVTRGLRLKIPFFDPLSAVAKLGPVWSEKFLILGRKTAKNGTFWSEIRPKNWSKVQMGTKRVQS